MEMTIALAVQDMHSSCSEISERASSRVRATIPAPLAATARGTTVPSGTTAVFASNGSVFGYARPLTDGTTKDAHSGLHAWSPPV